MSDLILFPHPDFPSIAVTSISVNAGRGHGGKLSVRFHVEGTLDDVIWPEFDGDAGRADGLWQHSCFEAFVGFVDEPSYCELNFAPSMKWAAYRFDDYRAGMRNIDDIQTYGHWTPGEGRLEMHAVLPELGDRREWRLGLSAVIEAVDGSKSYWAIHHPPGKPDFHNADCFAARVAAPQHP